MQTKPCAERVLCALPETEGALSPQSPEQRAVNSCQNRLKNPTADSYVLNRHLPFPPSSSPRRGSFTFRKKCGPLQKDTLWNAAVRLHLGTGSANLACDFLLTRNLPRLALTLLMANSNRCYFPVKLFISFVTPRQFWRLAVYLFLFPALVLRLLPFP